MFFHRFSSILLAIVGVFSFTGCSNTPPSPTVQITPPSQAQAVPDKTPHSSSASPTIANNDVPSPKAIGTPDQEPHIFSQRVVRDISDFHIPTTSNTFQLIGENFDSRTVVIIEDATKHTNAMVENDETQYILVHPTDVTPTTLNFKFPYDDSVNKGSMRASNVGVREVDATTVNAKRAEIVIVYQN